MIFRLPSIRKGQRADPPSRRSGEADSRLQRVEPEACAYLQARRIPATPVAACPILAGLVQGDLARPGSGLTQRDFRRRKVRPGRGGTVTMPPRLRYFNPARLAAG